MSELIRSADEYAARKHAEVGQVRKHTGAPYIVHPRAVQKKLALYGARDVLQAAALLHDTVEDTLTSIGNISFNFGTQVAELVAACTNVYTSKAYPTWNRSKRKMYENIRFAEANCVEAVWIRFADFLDNYESFVEQGDEFAKNYAEEMHGAMPLYRFMIRNQNYIGPMSPLYHEVLAKL